MAGPKNALAAWGVSALHAVELPSGMKALVRLPDVAKLMSKERFPQDLREIASRFAMSGIDLNEVTVDEAPRVIAFTYELVAETVKYLAQPGSTAWERFKEQGGSPVDEGWEPVSLTGPELSEMEVDQADITALSSIAARTVTPNSVTVAARLDRGMVEKAAEALEEAERASQPTIATFRTADREPGRADAGADGSDMGKEPERLPRSRRPGSALRRR